MTHHMVVLNGHVERIHCDSEVVTVADVHRYVRVTSGGYAVESFQDLGMTGTGSAHRVCPQCEESK